MKKNKTAVEWFAEQLSKLGYLHSCEHGNSPKVLDALKKAKAMEKEQHRDTWLDAFVYHENDNYIGKTKTFQEYYQETYEKQ